MKIKLNELRKIIREILEEDSVDQGHEQSGDPELVQLNHQGDGSEYDQMGNAEK